MLTLTVGQYEMMLVCLGVLFVILGISCLVTWNRCADAGASDTAMSGAARLSTRTKAILGIEGVLLVLLIVLLGFYADGAFAAPRPFDVENEYASAFEKISDGQSDTAIEYKIASDAEAQWVRKRDSYYIVLKEIGDNASEPQGWSTESTKVVADATPETACVDTTTTSNRIGTYVVNTGFSVFGLIDVEPEYGTKKLPDIISHTIHVPSGTLSLGSL